MPLNPNGVVARRPENQSPEIPNGHNPVGAEGLSIAVTGSAA
jgi:hypothetical protein